MQTHNGTHIDFHPEQAQPTHGHNVQIGEEIDPAIGERPITVGFSYTVDGRTELPKFQMPNARFARILARSLLAAADDADGNG